MRFEWHLKFTRASALTDAVVIVRRVADAVI